MRILLVRHGESVGNVDITRYRETPDFVIPLSERGHEQAEAVATFLDSFMWNLGPAVGRGAAPPMFRLWVSPYTRARQTADPIEKAIKLNLIDRREHILLAEQQFGVLDGIAGLSVEEHYPDHDARYKLYREHGGKFWCRMPAGENRFDVACRVHQAFGTFHRDADKHGIHNLIIVAHGTVIRAFVMMWLHLPYEWVEKEPNPKNCSVRLIEDGEDKGYIYEGGTP